MAIAAKGMPPRAPYLGMIGINVGILILFGILLAASAKIVVRAAVGIAHGAGLPTFLIGFLLLGMLTSTPELFITLQSVSLATPQLSVGTLLGGSILLLSFVIGACAVWLGKITLNHGMKMEELLFSGIVIAAPVAFLFDGGLSRTDGLLLVGVYLLQVVFVGRHERVAAVVKRHAKGVKHAWHDGLWLAVGIAGLFLSSRVVVATAEILIAQFHISQLVFGLFILSLGTNLPELTLAAAAVARRSRDIAFGDFLGSAMANTFILGLLGLFAPFSTIGGERLTMTLMLLVGVSLFFIWAVRSKQNITRREGWGLLVFYGLFVVYQLFLG